MILGLPINGRYWAFAVKMGMKHAFWSMGKVFVLNFSSLPSKFSGNISSILEKVHVSRNCDLESEKLTEGQHLSIATQLLRV